MQESQSQTPSSLSLMLEAKGIYKKYGRQQALTGLDIAVGKGEWLGLLGPNGAGKTTLMSILSGLIKADAGKMDLITGTFDLTRLRNRDGAIGMVPQQIALYGSLTARENLEVFGSFHSVPEKLLAERVDWALEWTGLTQRARDRVKTFSDGMKRRLNIACGVLHQPSVVLLDEPTVGVDPHARQRIWQMLKELKEVGTAIVHSSHQLDEIEAYCDRILIIDKGQLKACGVVNELLGKILPVGRKVTLRFSDTLPQGVLPHDFIVEGATAKGVLEKPARRLQEILSLAEQRNLELVEVKMDSPSLEDLFTKLTGEDLRE